MLSNSAIWSGRFNSTQMPMVSGTVEFELNNASQEYTTPLKIAYTGIYKFGSNYSITAKVAGDTVTCWIGQQKIVFTINHRTDQEIQGTYRSTNPNDQGIMICNPGKLTVQNSAPECIIS